MTSPLLILEKLNIRVIDPTPYTGLPTVSEREEMEQAQEEHLLSIPRRLANGCCVAEGLIICYTLIPPSPPPQALLGCLHHS